MLPKDQEIVYDDEQEQKNDGVSFSLAEQQHKHHTFLQLCGHPYFPPFSIFDQYHKYTETHFLKNMHWMISNYLVKFGTRTLKIGQNEYKLKDKLYELLFKRIPVQYTPAKLETYTSSSIQILTHTTTKSLKLWQ